MNQVIKYNFALSESVQVHLQGNNRLHGLV